MEMNVHSR